MSKLYNNLEKYVFQKQNKKNFKVKYEFQKI